MQNLNRYIEYASREEWLQGRINTLGASEVACVLGMGFQSPLDLWKVKTGKVKPKDLSDNERVKYGTEAEAHLRSLFALKSHDKYSVEYFPYRVYLNESKILSCTLDGELYRLCDETKGILEIKTVQINSKRELEDWNGKIKNCYYVQVCQQLSVTKYDFAIVYVELCFPDGNSELRQYLIERSKQVENDIKYVETEAVKWWSEYVVKRKQPPMKLTL